MVILDILQLLCFLSSKFSITQGKRLDEQNLIFFLSILLVYPLIASSFILLIIITIMNPKNIKIIFLGYLLNIHVLLIVYQYFNDIYKLGFPQINLPF